MAVPGAEVLGGQIVVTGQPGQEVALPLLTAPWIVHDPIPPRGHMAEHIGIRRREHVEVHCVHLVDVLAPLRDLYGRVGLQHHTNAPVRVGTAVPEAVLHSLHRMADRMAVDKVHQN
jgi:hypothetical protein